MQCLHQAITVLRHKKSQDLLSLHYDDLILCQAVKLTDRPVDFCFQANCVTGYGDDGYIHGSLVEPSVGADSVILGIAVAIENQGAERDNHP